VTAQFPDDFVLNPPATAEEIAVAEQSLRVTLPEEYRDFLLGASGGEGPLGKESYLVLWPAHELPEHNLGYKVDTDYASDLILIGTDGGNEVFAIRPPDGSFVAAPLIGMSQDAVQIKGSTLAEFLGSFR
jgi:hypothetical protein